MGSVLLAGGMGYIGSHTAVVVLEAGYEVCSMTTSPCVRIVVR